MGIEELYSLFETFILIETNESGELFDACLAWVSAPGCLNSQEAFQGRIGTRWRVQHLGELLKFVGVHATNMPAMLNMPSLPRGTHSNLAIE